MHSVESQATPSGATRAVPTAQTTTMSSAMPPAMDVQVIADRYGWTTPMARWWMSFAACSVGQKPDAMIAFLDKTVGGATMIRRR
ncbi:hypothetical protein TSH100_04825 [Azospirillum sp. TSH100]|uniref:hypothetical protein n=1 Tax=Azospirillum sp. TSH100 TaxID=652764 RepID=UPI000D6081FD|nr:hypothetical protein [Azospirillum sp. TSH100]PWC89371.1 hypothetical protein TSH100_04825 [Azospirillum sp. TSH100]